MSQGNRPMQMTIPRPPKQETDVQTDLNLLGKSVGGSLLEGPDRVPLRLAQFCTESGILRPFSDYYLYSELENLIGKLRHDVISHNDTSQQQKILQFLSNQIHGLLSRDLYIEGTDDKKTSYYALLSEKDKENLNLQIKYSAFQSKIRKADQKLHELELEIVRLKDALKQMHNCSEQNVIYRQCFAEINVMLRENRKVSDLEGFINQKINPLIRETEQKLDTINKNLSRDRRNKVKGVLAEYTKELQILSQDQNLSQEAISKSVAAFYSNLQHLSEENWIKRRLYLSSEVENLKTRQIALLSMLNRNIDEIITHNPEIKGFEQFRELSRIIEDEKRSGIEVDIVKGWIAIGSLDNRTVEVPVQDARTKELIGLLASEVKKMITKFPQIKTQLSVELLELIEIGVLEDSIKVDSLDRLVEIVVHQPDVFKVENVYNYSNKKDKDLIFHLRVLIKSLLEELEGLRVKYSAQITLDEGILAMLSEQVLDGIDVEAILGLYRPQPKIVEVEKIVDRPVYVMDELQHGVPIHAQKGVYGERIIEKPVSIEKAVPIETQIPIFDTVKEFVEVKTVAEIPVEIPTIVEKVVPKIMIEEKIIQIQVEKSVPCREEIKEIIEVHVEKPVVQREVFEKEVPVELIKEVVTEVEKYVDKPVYLFKEIERAVEVPVIKELFHEKPVYIEVEKKIPYVVKTPEIQQVIREVPKIIMESTEIIKPVPEIMQKIVQVMVEKDPKIIEVPVNIEKELIKEIEKEVFVEMTHFVKPDQVEVLKQVEVQVEKPIIQEVLISKEQQIEKVAPLYIREEKPIYVDIKVPFIKPEFKPVDLIVEKPVFLKEEIIKEVKVQVPVPIIIEKEIVKVQPVVREKVIEKIVEVPRVQIVEKEVEKIVVVPRIIEKIVEVPQIVQKCVVIQRPILEVAEIPREITVETKVEVPKVVEVIQQVLVENPVYNEVVVEVPQERVIEKEVPVEIQVERRIPVEVIREVPVNIYRDRIVEKLVQIHEVTVKDREVQIPFLVEQPVPIIQQKPVLDQKVIEKVVKVPQTIEKVVPAEKVIERPVEIQLIEEKVIEKQVAIEIPGESIIKYEKQYTTVELVEEKVIEVKVVEEVPKEVYLEVEKIVPLTVEKLSCVPDIQFIPRPQIIEMSKPLPLVNYKEIPIAVETTRHIPTRTILQEIKEIEVTVEKVMSVEVEKEKMLKVIENVKEWCTKQVERQIVSEVPVREYPTAHVQMLEVDRIIEPLKNKIVQIQEEEKCIDKVVEKIVMLPQLVEVVKTVHEISEIQSLGVARDVEMEIHTKQYVGLTKDLKAEIVSLLSSFRSKVRNQPDLKILIESMEKYLAILDRWIKFPKIVEVSKEVEVQIQKSKPILIPTQNSEKEMALMSIIEQLITGIKNFRKDDIRNNFDETILNLFFMDLDLSSEAMENRYTDYIQELRGKYRSFGNWADNHVMLLNSFLQARFSMTSIIEDSNKINRENKEKIAELEAKLHEMGCYSMINEFAKEKVASDYANLVKNLRSFSTTHEFIGSIIENHTNILNPQQYFNELKSSAVAHGRSQQVGQSYQVNMSIQPEGESMMRSGQDDLHSLIVSKDKQISSIIVRLSAAEQEKLENLRIRAETEKINDELRYENRMLRDKLEGDANSAVSNIQQIQARINQDWERRIQSLQENYQKEIERMRSQLRSQVSEGNSNNELTIENRRLSDENRTIKREIENIRRTQDSQNHNFENQKKRLVEDYEKKIKTTQDSCEREKKRQIDSLKRSLDSSQQTFEVSKQRLIDQYERKINILTETHQKELQKAQSSAVKKELSAEQSAEIRKLRDQIHKLQIELETSKKQVEAYQKSRMGQTTYTSGLKRSTVEEYTGPKYDVYRPEERFGYRNPQSEQGSLEGSRISRESRQSKTSSRIREKRMEEGEEKISSSRLSGRSEGGYKPSMTMKQLIEVKGAEEKDAISSLVMIKIIERIQEEADRGIINCYTPSNIYLSSFNPTNLDTLIIRFGAPITNKKSTYDGLYLPPQVHKGEIISIKSVVFCLGVIWDELIHFEIYYKTIGDIQNMAFEFKVRDVKINPILKNTLFEMMSKDPEKRLELTEVKRRLSLQKYISADSKPTSSRVSGVKRI